MLLHRIFKIYYYELLFLSQRCDLKHHFHFYFRLGVGGPREKEAEEAVAQGAGMYHRRSICSSYKEEGMLVFRWQWGSWCFWLGNVECISQSICFLGAKATKWNYLRGESVGQENSGTTKAQT